MKAFLWAVILAFGGFASFVYWYETRPETAAKRSADAARIEDERRPRKVNEANGCEVWAFKPSDRWLYFTRCDAKTETVNQWETCRSVSQGKTTRTECQEHALPITQEMKK